MIKNSWEKVRKIRRSKDGNALISNFGYLTLLQATSYIFPLITVPYLARTIGAEGYGKIAFATAIIVWLQTITDWGFRYTSTRDIAQNRDDPELVSEIFSNTIWAQILLMVISFGILAISIWTIPKLWEHKEVIFMTSLLIPGQIMFPEWFFQAMERMKFITILNLMSKLLFTIAVFVFIQEKTDYIIQPLLASCGYFLAGLMSIWIILKKWKIVLKPPHFKSIFNSIKGNKDIFINNLIPNIYNSFSIMLLGFWGGSVSNGILNAGGKFAGIMQQFMGIVSRTFFPFLSRRIDKHELFERGNLYLSVILTIILLFSAPILIKLFFTSEFYDAIPVLQIMAFSIIFVTLNYVYGTNYMIILGYERSLRNITFVCSLIGFIISFPFIYHFDFIGAALTITLTRGILGGAIMYRAKIIKKLINPDSIENLK